MFLVCGPLDRDGKCSLYCVHSKLRYIHYTKSALFIIICFNTITYILYTGIKNTPVCGPAKITCWETISRKLQFNNNFNRCFCTK